MLTSPKTPQSTAIRFSDIGARLRAYRIGKDMSPDALAKTLGISRAALYRAEKGQIRKIEMLVGIADVLGVSLSSLMGVGVEYVSTSAAFFERMRQLEEDCEQIIGMFGPVSYLLTTDKYDEVLQQALTEITQEDSPTYAESMRSVASLMTILKARKTAFFQRRPLIASLIASADLERFLMHGVIGRHDLPDEVVKERRRMARHEAENIGALLKDQPIGVQIGIVREPVPTTSFQIFRQADRSILAISPFRLGERPNVRLGVAMITSASEALSLHEDISKRLWAESMKGTDASEYIFSLIDKYGIKD